MESLCTCWSQCYQSGTLLNDPDGAHIFSLIVDLWIFRRVTDFLEDRSFTCVARPIMMKILNRPRYRRSGWCVSRNGRDIDAEHCRAPVIRS